jgi:hypothetical protein
MGELSKALDLEPEILGYNFYKLLGSGCYYIHGFDKIQKFSNKIQNYCNQKTQEDRREKILSRLNELGIEFEFFDGVDGRDVEVGDGPHPLDAGTWAGCCLSQPLGRRLRHREGQGRLLGQRQRDTYRQGQGFHLLRRM